MALETKSVPAEPGVYAVLRESDHEPSFLRTSGAGWFKGRDPTVDEVTLREKWIPRSQVVYIGKAANLRVRLRQYRQHGEGKPIGHWGGRFIWQLADFGSLLVAWKQMRSPRLEEQRLLRKFREASGGLPFANLAK